MTPLPVVHVRHPHVVIDADGRPLVEGTLIPVSRIFLQYRNGKRADTLVRRYPGLGTAKVFDALAFAYDNLELMAADLAWEREQGDAARHAR